MRKKRLLLPSALLGALLFAAPAMAQPTAVDKEGNNVPLASFGAGVAVSPEFGDEYIVVTPAAGTDRVAVISTGDKDWTNELSPFGDLVILHSNATPVIGAQFNGFRFQSTTDGFDGFVKGNSITVVNASGDAFGAAFYDTSQGNNAADISGIIDITGTIKVTSTVDNIAYGATGFLAGKLLATSEVSIGSIKATGEIGTGYATGLELFGGTETGSLLTVGSIDVNGPMALGITMWDSAEGRVEVGQIDVTGDWRAAGIFIGQADKNGSLNTLADADELVLKGNINVKGSHNAEAGELGGYAAVGVLVGNDAAIELDGDVNIKATATAVANNETAAIHTGGWLGLNLMGYTFSTENDIIVGDELNVGGYDFGNGIAYGGTFKAGNVNVTASAFFESVDNTTLNVFIDTLTVGDDLIIDADGSMYDIEDGKIFASFNSLNVGEDLFIDAGDSGEVVLGLNFANTTISGTGSEATGNVTIIAGGDLDEGYLGSVLTIAADDSVQLLNRGIFTGYEWEIVGGERVGIEAVRLNEANLQDEFFAAGMIHNRLTGYNMVRDRFISAERRAGNGYRGQWCDPCEPIAANPCDPCGTGVSGLPRSAARNAWINYVGRGNTYGDWDILSNGVQLGTELYRTNRSQFGVIFGYEDGRAERPNGGAFDATSGRIDSEDMYGGFYAARVLQNGADVRFVYNYGQQKFDMSRTYWGETFTSDFKGRTHEINLEYGKRFHGGAWSLRPFAAIDFYSMHLGSASELPVEAGANPSLTYGKTTTNQVFFRPGIDLRLQGKRAALNTGLSYAVDVRNQSYQTRISGDIGGMEPITLPAYGTKMGGQLLNFNVGGDLKLGSNFTVFGGYDLQAVVDRAGGVQHTGHVGGAVRW